MMDPVPSSNSSTAAPPRPLPRVRGLPLVGALPMLLREKLALFESARRAQGDLYVMDLGLADVVIMSHPRHAQHVLRDNARNYRKGDPIWNMLRTLLGNGLAASEGDFWLRQRRMMQPQFHRKRLAALTDLMVEAIDEGMLHWDDAAREGRPLDMAAELARITMKVIVKTLFGAGISLEEADMVGEQMTHITSYVLWGAIAVLLPPWLPVPGRRRYREAIRIVDDIVFRIIDRRSSERASEADLIGMLLDLVDAESGERMTRQQLRDEAVTLFLAGYETTAQALAWTFHTLTQAPAHASALASEIDGALGRERPRFEHIAALGYAQRVIREVLRLYPPSYFVSRKAVADDEIDGFHIPAGALVAVFTYGLQRHPGEWERPHEFDPERFLPERSASRHGLAWMPFGAGQRQCIGNEFAMLEAQLILTRVMQRYEISAIPGREATVHVSGTLRPKDGVWLRLKRRG